MDPNYFRALAARCLAASRGSFDLHAVEEFRSLLTSSRWRPMNWSASIRQGSARSTDPRIAS